MNEFNVEKNDVIYDDKNAMRSKITSKDNKRKLSKTSKIILGIFAAFLVVIIISLVSFIVKSNDYDNKFLPNTILQGTNVSDMTLEQAYEALTNDMDELTITIKDPFVEDVVLTGVDIDLKIDKTSVEIIKAKQNKWNWLSQIFGSGIHESVGVLYDAKKVAEITASLPAVIGEGRIEPKNTFVSYINGQFVAGGEAKGTKANADKVNELISKAISNGGGIVDISTLFEEPRWTADMPEIQAVVSQLNTKLDKKISYNIDKIPNAETLTKDQIASFITLDTSDMTQVKIIPNNETIISWLREIGKKYDTSGIERTYTTAYGKVVTLAGGTYGWITDEPAMIPLIIEDLLSDDMQRNRDFVYKQEVIGPKGEGLSEFGTSYVDIDKTEQMVRVIKDNAVVFEARTVTGTNNPKRNTPDGFWSVLEKRRDYTMTGEIVPSTGKPEYITKTCTWIRFTWSGCGMHCSDHGARTDWRVNAWLTNGSHGCANMHHGDVDKVYGMVENGLPVIVHL